MPLISSGTSSTFMRAANMVLIAFLLLLTATSAINAMPDSFYQAMSKMRPENTLCVKNYDARSE